jgi:hypothetical protein
MSAKYTTEVKIETYLNKSIETGKADDAILAAERFIDNYTDRNFKADTVASIRYYDGNGRQNLPIDDCIAVTKVEQGSNVYGDSFSEIPNTGADRYYLMPANNEADRVPINKLHLRNRYWIEGFQNHRITAKWGYSENAPDDIAMAATILAAAIYESGRSGSVGGIKSEKIGEYSVSFTDDRELADFNKAMQILDSYKRLMI